MQSRANWCLVCLHPIDEGDRDIAVLLANSGSEDREIPVHGHCYRVGQSPRLDDTATVHRHAAGAPSTVEYRANWCLVCLHPIEERDQDIAVLLASSGSEEHEILVHGHCYRARRSFTSVLKGADSDDGLAIEANSESPASLKTKSSSGL
jgi:hypothetical protein